MWYHLDIATGVYRAVFFRQTERRVKMTDDQTNQASQSNNPWKTGVIATAAALGILVAAGFTFAAFNPSESVVEPDIVTDAATPESSTPVQLSETQETVVETAPRPAENCGRYLAGTERDVKRVAKEGAIGTLIGAATGAAGGAIADGGSGAGKGAGIGAVVGAVAGAAHGYTKEDERINANEKAYHDCLARN